MFRPHSPCASVLRNPSALAVLILTITPMFLEALESRRLLTVYTAHAGDSLQSFANNMHQGDTLHVTAGNYAGFAVYGQRGTSAQHITYLADPSVSITGKAPAETQVDTGIEFSGFDSSSGCAYIDLVGFNVNDANRTIVNGFAAGIRIRFSNHITVTNCKAMNCGAVGIYGSHVSNVTISGCESAWNNIGNVMPAHHGFYIANSCSDVTIDGCDVHDNNGNGIHSNGDGGVNTRFTISGNRIWNNGAEGGSAINCDGLQDSTIRNNFLFNNKNKGISLYAIDATGPSSGDLIDENVIEQATGNSALQLHTGPNTIGTNAIINDGGGYAVENDGGAQTWVGTLIYRGVLVGLANGANKIKSPFGDANLDGQVTGDDYGTVDSVWGSIGDVELGDLNHDGIISGEDYAVIDSNLKLAGVGRVLWMIDDVRLAA